MTQLLGAKGLSGYIDGKIALPTQTPTGTSTTHPTPIYSTTPTADEWHFRDQLTRGHITLNCTDVAGLGVKTTGTAKEAWDSIQAGWGRSTDMRRSHAQELLNAEEASVQEHIKLLRTRKAAIDNLSATAMNDETWLGIIIQSIPPTARWLPVIPSLYALKSSADIVSILLAHSMILNRGNENEPTLFSSNTALIAQGEDGCANPNCKAKIRSTHTTANCYWPGGGKEGQFPPNFGQRSKAKSATLNSHETTQHFALSAWISKQHGTSITVSEILIEDPDDTSHHTSLTMEDNAQLFDTLNDMHTVDRDTAILDIGIPFTPDITLLSITSANPTETSSNISDVKRNVPVEGERENLDEQVNQEDNQPLPQSDEPEPGLDNIDQPTTQHFEEDSTEVENRKPIDGNDPILTKYDDYLTNSFLEGGAGHKTALTPGTNEIPDEELLLAQPEEKGQSRGKDDSGEEGKGVDEVDWGITTVDERPKEVGENRENMEGTRKSTDPGFPDFEPVHLNSSVSDERIVDLEQTDCSCGDSRKNNPRLQKALEDPAERPKVYSKVEEGRRKVCPSTVDDTKSILDDAESIRHPYTNQIPTQVALKLTDTNTTPLNDQHLSDIAEIATTKDLPPIGTTGTLTNRPLEEPPRISSDQSRGGGGVSWSNPRKYRMATAINEAQEQREVNPKEGDDTESNPDDAKSNTRKGDDAKSNPLPPIRDHPNFNDAEHMVMPVDQNATLLKGQHHTSLAEIIKMENLPYQEGIGPLMHAPMGTKLKTPPTTTMTAEFLEHSDAVFTTVTDVITPERLEDLGSTHSTAAKHVFRDLKGTRPVIFGRKSENNHLQLFEGAGEASQHKKWGYIPMLDGRNVPWINPREQDLSTRSTKVEEDTCGPHMTGDIRYDHDGRVHF